MHQETINVLESVLFVLFPSFVPSGYVPVDLVLRKAFLDGLFLTREVRWVAVTDELTNEVCHYFDHFVFGEGDREEMAVILKDIHLRRFQFHVIVSIDSIDIDGFNVHEERGFVFPVSLRGISLCSFILEIKTLLEEQNIDFWVEDLS